LQSVELVLHLPFPIGGHRSIVLRDGSLRMVGQLEIGRNTEGTCGSPRATSQILRTREATKRQELTT
jgi:hypothetical protein